MQVYGYKKMRASAVMAFTLIPLGLGFNVLV